MWISLHHDPIVSPLLQGYKLLKANILYWYFAHLILQKIHVFKTIMKYNSYEEV